MPERPIPIVVIHLAEGLVAGVYSTVQASFVVADEDPHVTDPSDTWHVHVEKALAAEAMPAPLSDAIRDTARAAARPKRRGRSYASGSLRGIARDLEESLTELHRHHPDIFGRYVGAALLERLRSALAPQGGR